ncbi:MAG: S41 family peptidase [Verrucomicrobiia bacterium]
MRISAVILLVVAGGALFCRAAIADSSLRETTEVISVLKSNYVDRDKLNDKLLNEATVDGLIDALGHGVVIITPQPPSTNEVRSVATEPRLTTGLARAEVIDPNIGYIRLSDVTDEIPAALDTQLKRFAEAKVTAYVLDLRYADGTNFAAAAEVAGRFLADGQELFTLKSSEKGVQVFRASSAAKSGASAGADLTTAPLMLLVNAQTRGSAEALAGALRAQDRGIVVGSETAGSAAAWQDVKLADGRTLRLATAKIVVPPFTAGGQSVDLFPNGIMPDVTVKIDTQTEHDVVFAPATNETLTVSLQPRVKKKDLTEAQLVKAFHGQSIDGDEPQLVKPSHGQSVDGDEPSSDSEHDEEGEIQNVRDVVLQRAVDILKGIRVLLSWQ